MRLAATTPHKDDNNVSSAVTDAKDYPIKRKALRALNQGDITNKKWKADGFLAGFRKTQNLKSDNTRAANGYVENEALNVNNTKVVDVSHKFELSNARGATEKRLEETDAHRLSQRQKQINYGKNTFGYEHYFKLVPRNKRKSYDPQTPDRSKLCSKRRWDGLVRQWRRHLHSFDPPLGEDEENPDFFSLDGQSKGNSPGNQKNQDGDL